MDALCQRKTSDTVSIAPPALEEVHRTRRKLRKISQVQIALGIGLLLVGILVCAGAGLVLLISVPSRDDVRVLLEKVESLEDTLSSLRKDIAENNLGRATMDAHPVSMENFMPSDMMRDLVDRKDNPRNYVSAKRPQPEKPGQSFSRYLMGRLNQTVSGLDEGNKLIFSKLNRSLVRLKNDFDIRENEMDRKLKENSKQLIKLSNIASRLVAKLERGELESQVSTLLDMITVLSKKGSIQDPPYPDLLKKIGESANQSMVYFGSILSDEMIIIQKNIQEAIIRYVDETKHHYANIYEILNANVAGDLRLEDWTKAIRNDLGTIQSGIDPFDEKIDLLMSGQSRMEEKYDSFADSMKSIRSKTDEIDMRVTKVIDEQDQLSDVARNVRTVLFGFNGTKKSFIEKLDNASEMLEKILKKDPSSQYKNLNEFSAMIKDELKNALETVESAMSERSEELSTLIKQEIKKILNEHFEKGMQMMEIAMQDESASQSADDLKQILKEINGQFEKSLKMFEQRLNDQALSVSNTTESPDNSLISKVCTKSEGCTSVKYASKRCFKVIEAAVDEATWVQAKRKCQLLGGYLAEIHNAHEYDILIKSLPTYGNYWVGGTDRGFEGYWHWDHSLLKITLNNWAPGQPNNHRYVEHCLHILHDEITVWNDLRCMSKMGYVCEKEGPKCDVWT